MKVGAFIRVSSQEQLEGYSLDAQRRAIADYCAARGWGPPDFHAEEAVSAWTDDLDRRPSFAAMLAAAERGRYQVVVVHKLDRFARSLIVTLRELQRLERANVAFVSLSENLDFTTPIGKVVLSVLAAFAQYYSDNLSAEVKKGLAEKRRQGLYVGRPPFGSKRVDGLLAIDPERADDLRRALEYAGAMDAGRAAEALNVAGVRPPRHAAGWGRGAIMTLRGEPGRWLLDQGEPWASLYRAAAARPLRPVVRRAARVRMLTGLVRCACGGLLSYQLETTRRDGTARRYGICRQSTGRTTGCRRWGKYMDEVEAAVERWLFALPDPRRSALRPEETRDTEAIERRRQRLVRLYRDDLLTDAQYEQERIALQREVARLPATAARREEVGIGLARARADWPTWDGETRRLFLAHLVRHFVVEGGAVRPVFQPELASLWPDQAPN